LTITEFRDKHQPTMDEMTLRAGVYLEEKEGLRFGKDFVTGDALELAASALTRSMTNAYRDEQANKAILAEVQSEMLALSAPKPNRFEDDDWDERWPHGDETDDV
jgi:hypothetical protein